MTRTIAWLCLLVFFSGCSSEDQSKSPQIGKPQKELLVFCGITMIDPVRQLRRTAKYNHSYFFAKAQAILALPGSIVMNHFRKSGKRSKACS